MDTADVLSNKIVAIRSEIAKIEMIMESWTDEDLASLTDQLDMEILDLIDHEERLNDLVELGFSEN